MRIVEFDDEGKPVGRQPAGRREDARPAAPGRAPAVKVVEFDNDGGPGRHPPAGRRVATPESVGPIKIREFGAGDGPGRSRADLSRAPAGPAVAPPGKVKVVEFGTQGQERAPTPASGKPKMKIVEF